MQTTGSYSLPLVAHWLPSMSTDSLHGNVCLQIILQCKKACVPSDTWMFNGRAMDMTVGCLLSLMQLHCVLPTSVTFEQSKICEYFLACLEKKCVMPFPIRRQRRHVSPAHMETVNIYCVCHLTDDGSQMIQCNHCHEWFHTKCVRVVRQYLRNVALTWLFASCKN